MNRSVGAGAIAALLVLGGPCAAVAAPIYLGSLSGQPNNDNLPFSAKTSGAFDDVYSFTLTNPSAEDFVVSLSIITSYSNTQKMFSPLTLSLFDSADGSGMALKSANAVTTTTSSQTGSQSVSVFDTLSAGTHSFSVSGDSDIPSSYGGSLSVDVSAVPLPASAPLFAAAVLGLGLVGMGARRKKANVTA